VNFVLDNSRDHACFLGPQHSSLPRQQVLDAMKRGHRICACTWGLRWPRHCQSRAKGLVTRSTERAFLEMLEGADIEADTATFSHALSDTLQLARRYKLSL